MNHCARKISFAYGHRVMDHESKCASLHGHNGIIWIHATPIQGLDSLGRVIDFSVLKNIFGGWIEKYWDHTMILYEKDQVTLKLLRQVPSFKEIFILDTNPTAENMAAFLLKEICPKILNNRGIIVEKIIFYETENCFAEISLNENDTYIRDLYLLP